MEDQHARLNGLTILNILNEDCWRAILDLLPMREIIRSERVSRQWQHVVYQYLQGARFSIEYPWYKHERQSKLCVLTMDNDDPDKFDKITRKWGLYIKTADCVNRTSLNVLRKNCPNLEDITFYGLQNDILLNEQPNNYKNLKRVHFRSCEISDKCVSCWLTSDTIEELAISDSHVTGLCLSSLQTTRLKTLCLRECDSIELQHLLSAADHLTELTKLKLAYIPKDIFQNVHLLLDKMPNLEDLCLWWQKKMEIGNEVVESVGRLRRLKRLDLSFNPNVSDEWLATIARGCRLRELLVEGCLGPWAGASPAGVLAVCRAAGPALRVLRVGSSSGKLLDCHVEAFLAACPNLTMAEVDTSNKPTILDYLHEDCWRAVLEYVPVKDIILSERVSRQWQAVTLAYLQRTRIGIEDSYVRVSEAVANVRRVTLAKKRLPLFWRWTCKLGASVVATYCTTEEFLETITKNCPNLEAVTFLTLTEQQLQTIQIEHFKFLQRIRFYNCDLSDYFISQFIANKALEELQIDFNRLVASRFLLDIELTSLKSLQLYVCTALESRYLLLAAARLTELRRLVLEAVPQDIYKQLHLVFKRTVKLEYLHMFNSSRGFISNDERGRLFEGVCGLGRLRHLSVSRVATDAHVEAVARCCKELRSLELFNCDEISAFGLGVLACSAARLTSLCVTYNQRLFDDNVVAIVTQCPNLTLLDVAWCSSLSPALAARAAAARRATRATEPLRLRVTGTNVETCDPALLEGIVLDYSRPENASVGFLLMALECKGSREPVH